MKILLAEDDLALGRHLSNNLREHGMHCVHSKTFAELEDSIEDMSEFDVAILDRLLGPHDTKHILAKIKLKKPFMPILILSAVCTPNEKTELINLGADDYMGKPFSTQELIARIRALTRRTAATSSQYLIVGNVVVDLSKRIISVNEVRETLPAKEFLILQALAKDPGRVLSRNDLLDFVWGVSKPIETNVVEATITNLRKKIQEIGGNIVVRNSRNQGYWIEI
jgi:DNA-binding response OmpR family regulator